LDEHPLVGGAAAGEASSESDDRADVPLGLDAELQPHMALLEDLHAVAEPVVPAVL